MEETFNKADYECATYTKMLPEINLHYDLMNGTRAMREKGYLKRFPLESNESFNDRESTACLFNKYEKAVTANAGLILKREPQIVESDGGNKEFFETFQAHWENITSDGTHGTVFISEFFEQMFAGHCFIVVDAPALEGKTAADQKDTNWRPFWNLYRANQAISWRTEVIANKTELSQIIFKRFTTIPKGNFGEEIVTEYKGYRLTEQGVSWAIFREQKNDAGGKTVVTTKTGMIVGMKRLPIVVGYGRKKGFLTSSPPLKDLAYQNVRHFNKESDYDKADAYAGLVFPVAIGETNVNGLGYDLMIECKQGGDFQIRETTGQALEAKRALLDRIEKQMDELGLGLLVDRTNANLTATQALIDNTQNKSGLAAIATSGKDAIELAIEMHGDFMNVEPEKVCSIDLGFKAEQLVLSAETARMLLEAANSGKLSTFDFLSTLKLGGVMPDSFDLDEAVKRALAERQQTKPDGVIPSAN